LIPRRLIRVWLGPKPIPALFQDWWSRFADLHPDWERRTILEGDVPNLLAAGGPMQRIYEDCPTWAGASDVLRMAALFEMGGIYVDCDMMPLRSFEPLLDGGAFATERSGASFNNAVIGAPAGDPAVMAWGLELPEWYWTHRADTDRTDVLVGPTYLTHVWWDRPDVRHMPRQMFYPFRDFKYPRKGERAEIYETTEWPEEMLAAHYGNKNWGGKR
jgi:hypothetical protein